MLYQENAVLEALKRDGIEVEQVTVVKNGVSCKGIRICSSGSVNPVIYYSEEETAQEFLSRVHNILLYDTPQIDLDDITAWERVKESLYLSVQKQSEADDDVLKKSYLNLDVVMRLTLDFGIDGEGTVKISERLAEKIGVTEEELWLTATQNTRDSTVVRRLSDILGIDDDEEEGGLYVASAVHCGGASVLFLPDVFAQFCTEHDEKDCYILPSSTEEVIVLLGSEVRDRMSVRELARMVEVINAEQVDPVLQLDPVVYQYRLCDDSIHIAARV